MRSALGRWVALAAILVSPSLARADDRAIAEEAFKEGRALMTAGRVAEACAKFDAAAQLAGTAGVRLNLADCYMKLGKTATAWAKAQEALAIAQRSGDAAAAAVADQQIASLEPRLSRVTIATGDDAAVPGLRVQLDGSALPSAVLGTAIPVDPGEHEVTVAAPGRRTWSAKLSVPLGGGRVNVAVPRLADEAADEVHTGGGWSRGTSGTLALVSAGLGVAGVGVGSVFGLVASSKKSAYEQHMSGGRCVDPQCASLSQDAVSSANVSTIAFVAGGVLLATGAVLWLTAPPAKHEGASVALVPATDGHAIAAAIHGTF